MIMDEMPVQKGTKISLGDVAREAGISTTSASCALRNRPGVSPATRKRVLKIAKRLNYFPDARVSLAMTSIRQSTDKDLLPIVWLNATHAKDSWRTAKYLIPYQEGARERLKELGYRIEEMWTKQKGFSMRRTSQLLLNRGIEGIIVTDPAKHIRLSWDKLAGVCIGGGLLAPGLHRVAMDSSRNLALALKSLKRLGYKRTGIFMTEQADSFSHHGVRATALYFDSTLPKERRVRHYFYSDMRNAENEKRQVANWIKKERPDSIVCHSSSMVALVEAAGHRVPEDIAVVHTGIEDDVLDWAGIYANKRQIGRLAASKLVSLIQQRQFGVPEIASTEYVPGEWRPGCTVLPHK